MQIGLNQSEIESLVLDELLAPGRYTLSQPGALPVLTSEQRKAIAGALARVLAANNDQLVSQLQSAGVLADEA